MADSTSQHPDDVSVQALPSRSTLNVHADTNPKIKRTTKPTYSEFAGLGNWEPRALIESVKLPVDGIDASSSAVIYTIQVRLRSGLQWAVTKRYSEFRELHKSIGARVKHLSFPAKHFVRNHNTRFLEQRRQDLEIYINELLEIRPLLLRKLYNFLGVYVNIQSMDRREKLINTIKRASGDPEKEGHLSSSGHSQTALSDDSWDGSDRANDSFVETFQSAPAQLGNLVELCFHMGEVVSMSENVLERLYITRNQLIDMRRNPGIPREAKKTFTQLAARFEVFLTQNANHSTIDNAAKLVHNLYGFHCELDGLECLLGLEKYSWKDSWVNAVRNLDDKSTTMAKTNSASVCTELAQTGHGSINLETELWTQTEDPTSIICERDVQRDSAPFGSGSSGTVFRGTWAGLAVVIKNVDVSAPADMRAFLQEDKIWHMARHPNVVTYYGVCYVSRPCFFVSEEAVNGNVPDFLDKQRCQKRSLVWRMMHGAAMGLKHLHGIGIIHGDLKCNNIVVDSDEVAKLTDFGMSFENGSTPPLSGGPVRWTAPECLIQKQAPSFQSDKYSLGMCIIEAATGSVPWGACVDEQVIDGLAHHRFLSRPAELNNEQWGLVTALCAFEPGRRCILSHAIDQLEKFAVAEAAAESDIH